MHENRLRALISAYYLSRFNQQAYDALGFGGVTRTHESLGALFGVSGNAVKNRRDEFDPIHDNPRAGWHQRELSRSRAQIVEQFSQMTEPALRALILSWINGDVVVLPPLAIVDEEEGAAEEAPLLSSARLITGRKAEEHFIERFAADPLPIAGRLVDCRADGQGYDFKIVCDDAAAFVEVKGLEADSGTISMTAKEWITAKDLGDSYYLVLVARVHHDPVFSILANPASKLTPTLRLQTVVQESWTFQSSAAGFEKIKVATDSIHFA